MKKTWLALAALASVSGVASAQSSVTLFGVVDTNLRYIKNGGDSRFLVGTDGNSSSRLGVRGIEDLGGGLKAGFWLESQVNGDNGTSNQPDTGATAAFNTTGRFWHRRSTVSLIGNFGEIRLGRDTTPTWNALADFDVFGTVGVGDTARTYQYALGTGVAADTRVRADNLVSYFLPASLGGLYGQLTVGPGEGTAGKRYYGGRLGFKSGPFDVTGAYQQTQTVGDEKLKLAVISGSYDFGVVKLLATVQQWKFLDRKDNHYYIGAQAPLGSGLLKASYTRAQGKGDLDGRDADHFAVGYVHNLSKRTAVYTTVGYIKNKGAANFTTQGGGPALAAGEKSTGVDLGIRHSF